jgi:hypothetical protein
MPMFKASLLCAVFYLSSVLGRQPEAELKSMTFGDAIPKGLTEGAKKFFSDIKVTPKSHEQPARPSLRQESRPNVPLPMDKDYVEPVPQIPVANTFLEKEVFVFDSKCHVRYAKYEKPTVYLSHVLGMDSCYLSALTSDINDPSTYVYVKSTYESVHDAENGKSYALTTTSYEDSACTKKSSSENAAVYTDTLPQSCTAKADAVSVLASKYDEAPARNMRLNKGTSVSLFSTIEDCVAGSGSMQERVSREDNCFRGLSFECLHGGRYDEFEYSVTSYPNEDCSETLPSADTPSQIVTTKFTRAEGCANVMPLDATYGHPVIHCGQEW